MTGSCIRDGGGVRPRSGPGTLAARPGLPAATMALLCATFAFFAVDGFVPLLLTAVGRPQRRCGRDRSHRGRAVLDALLAAAWRAR